MKKILFTLATLFCLTAVPALAQDKPAADTAAAPAKLPSNWTRGLLTQFGFSQLSLTNWAAGGVGSISLNTYLDGYTNYKKDKYLWNNELQMGYGFIQNFEDGYKKSDDRLIFDSKFGYKATEKLYFSAIYNFRSQFADGYTGTNLTSALMAPAYMTLGLGIDYQPAKNLSINFAPLTGKTVMVSIPELRSKYGNADDQFCRFELGAQVKVDAKVAVKDFTVVSNLQLFSDYLDNPLDVKVNWDANVDAKISKYFSVTLRTSLIYDSKIKSAIKRDASGNPVLDTDGNNIMVAGVQFKEIFSVGFSYTIGKKK